MKKLFSFLAMMLLFAACQTEPGFDTNENGLVTARFSVGAHEISTRADETTATTGFSSALGAIDNFTDADWANYNLRFIFEVYAKDDNGSGNPIAKERQVHVVDKFDNDDAVFFEVRLVPNKEYKFVVFADFVNNGTTAEDVTDLYYDTTDLRNITMIDGKMDPMDEARDAYFITENRVIKTDIEAPLTLTRPFGKIRVVTTDYEHIAKYAAPAKAEVTYYNHEIFKSFNAVNGQISTARQGDNELKFEYDLAKDKLYTADRDSKSTDMTLFADYLLARPEGQSEVNFILSVYDAQGGLIKSNDFNLQIPIERNHLTTIEGNLLTTQTNIKVTINDDLAELTPILWEEAVEEDVESWENGQVDTDGNYEFVVNGKTDSFLVTVNNEAVVNGKLTPGTYTLADKAAIDDKLTFTVKHNGTRAAEVNILDGQMIVEANEANEAEYTIDLNLHYEKVEGEKKEEYKVSYNYTGEITIAEPEAYKLYFNNLANWTKVYAHIWANDGEDLGLESVEWPGRELTETEELDGVTYYVFQLPAVATGKTLNVVFNDGAGTQTQDLAGVVEGNLFFDNYVEPVAPSETILYLQPNNNWKNDNARFAAYFFGNGDTWVDMTLVEGETNIYAVTVPTGFENIIFCRMNPGAAANNWNNKWNQTSDLKVPTDGTNLYTVNENTWDKGGGEWSVYAPAVKPEEPTVLATPVVEAAVAGNVVTLTWAAVENAAQYGITVGTEMPVFVEETTYTFTGEYETEYTFNVVAVPADEEKFAVSEAAVVTATTEAAPVVEPTYTTVAEFLAADVDDATFYTLKGTITRVANTNYGNFDLTDETGTIYVYGLYSEDGATNKYWAASGAQLGDDIVISAVRAEYNGSAQAGSARFLGLTSPGTLAFWSFSKTATTFTSAGGEQVITVDAYNLTDAVSVTSDNAQFSAAYADGALTITAAENTTTETINGNITVKAGALEQVITVAQGGVSVGGGTEVVAEATMKNFGWANSAGVTEATIDDNVTVKFFQGGASTAPAYYTSGEAVRLYQNGAYMTVSANGKTIKSMEITFANNMYYVAADSGELTEEAATRTWTGDATEVKITCTGTDKNHRAYIAAIKVTYID